MTPREAAKAAGETHYNGGTCKNCGNTKRTVSKCMCVVCNIELGRQWRKRNPERSREFSRNWRQKPENKEKEAIYGREWKRRNREKVIFWARRWQENNKKKHTEYQKRYTREHGPDIRRRHRARRAADETKRRAKKLNACAAWADYDKIQEIYCSACNLTEKTGRLHHVDHIIPLQGKYVCGLHVETNLQVVTASANMSKGNKFVQV